MRTRSISTSISIFLFLFAFGLAEARADTVETSAGAVTRLPVTPQRLKRILDG